MMPPDKFSPTVAPLCALFHTEHRGLHLNFMKQTNKKHPPTINAKCAWWWLNRGRPVKNTVCVLCSRRHLSQVILGRGSSVLLLLLLELTKQWNSITVWRPWDHDTIHYSSRIRNCVIPVRFDNVYVHASGGRVHGWDRSGRLMLDGVKFVLS